MNLLSCKVLVLGHGDHGKDKFAEYLNYYQPNLTNISSSFFCAEEFIFDVLKDKYKYRTLNECYEDRRNHREEWYELIKDYNSPVKSKLARAIVSKYAIYVGMRDDGEYEACIKDKIFTHIFWVDRSKIKPLESKKSFKIDYNPNTMIYIDNNKGLDSLGFQANVWGKELCQN